MTRPDLAQLFVDKLPVIDRTIATLSARYEMTSAAAADYSARVKRAFIADDGSRPVPLRLRNAPTRLMKGLGYGKGYRYAHDEADAYAAGERYLPDDMPDVAFYEPTGRGAEARIGEKLRALRTRDETVGGKRAPPATEE